MTNDNVRHRVLKLVLGWELLVLLAGVNLAICLHFWLRPLMHGSKFELRWDGWLYGILLLGFPALFWLSDRRSVSPLRASVRGLVAVAVIFVPPFVIKCCDYTFMERYPLALFALVLLAWAEILALSLLFIPYRGGRVSLAQYGKSVVVGLYFVGVLAVVPVVVLFVVGVPGVLACLILPFLRPLSDLFVRCAAGLGGLIVGAGIVLLASVYAGLDNIGFGFPFLLGLLSPLGGAASIAITMALLRKRRAAEPPDGSDAASDAEDREE